MSKPNTPEWITEAKEMYAIIMQRISPAANKRITARLKAWEKDIVKENELKTAPAPALLVMRVNALPCALDPFYFEIQKEKRPL